MPVKPVGKKFVVRDKEYDTEAEANKAYMAYLNEAMGIKKTPKPKKKAKENREDDEDVN